MPAAYYDFSYGDWRFLVLDGTELAEYSRYNHPELAEEGDSVWNSVQDSTNGYDWNGGISKTQQLWIRTKIEEAESLEQNVILFCHFTLFPDTIENCLWNNQEIISLLEDYPNVIAYINGHWHPGSYGLKNGIHYIGQAAMVDTPDQSSFAILEIYPKELRMKGYGNISDTIFEYQSFKKKTMKVKLSDSIINYSFHTGDLAGTLSNETNSPNNLVIYVLTNSYQNEYFDISDDSLILNTEEDLSKIPNLKINVIAVDCDGDTFPAIFPILFDTTVMKFRYTLPDSLLSVYSNYTIYIDSLIDDYSRNGLTKSIYFDDTSIATCSFSESAVTILPLRTGRSKVFFIAFDSYTGKVFQQVFNLEIYDPLNHPPYHKDTTNLIVQLGEPTNLPLNQIFFDPDKDSLFYDYVVSDSTELSVLCKNDTLIMDCIKAGVVNLQIIAKDRYGGIDTLSLTVFINGKPMRNKAFKEFVFPYEMGCAHIDLDTIFIDPNYDHLKYALTTQLTYEIGGVTDDLSLCTEQSGVYKIYLTADDLNGGIIEDSLQIRFNRKPQATFQFFQLQFEKNDEFVTLELDTMFSKEPDDTLIYSLIPLLSDSFNYLRDGNILIIYPMVVDTFHFVLYASDNYGAVDSTRIEILYKPDFTYLNIFHKGTKFAVFPNPVKGSFKIQYMSETNQKLKLFITDMAGKIILQKDNITIIPGINIYKIEIHGKIKPGAYILQLLDTKQLLSMKMLVQ